VDGEDVSIWADENGIEWDGVNTAVAYATEIGAPFWWKVKGGDVTVETLDDDQRAALETAVYDREFNPKHEDDYFNAGGFYGHWSTYTEDEKAELLKGVL